MLEMFTCERGHAWEVSGGGRETPLCPTCGAPPDLGPMLDLEAPHAAAAPPAQSAPAAPLPLLDGRGFPVIAGYEVLESQGQGSGGVRLYRARQVAVGREVLLQVVFAREDSSQKAWNYLRGEAGGHGKLTHPNVLCLYEIGERDRQLFYNAAQFVDGPTLAQKVADKPLPFDQIAVLMELLARAVAYASEQNVLHRHLEPSAVVLQKVPAPKIGSAKVNSAGAACRLHGGYYLPLIRGFGLARRPVEGDTFDAELYSEPGFLSPEQAWGRTRDLGPHTDVYGLGGILYFLLCGRAPYRGPSLVDIVDAIQTAPLVPPSRTRSVPESLQYICKKALSRQPGRRYQNAGAMADDLRLAAGNFPLLSRKASVTQALGLWCRRQPAVAALLALTVLGFAGTMFALRDEGTPRERPRDFAVQPWPQIEQLLAERNNKDKIDGLAACLQFERYRRHLTEVSRVGPGTDEGAALLARCPEEQRDLEWYFLDRKRDNPAAGQLPLDDSANVGGMCFEPSRPGVLAAACGRLPSKIHFWSVEKAEASSSCDLASAASPRAVSLIGDRVFVAGGDREGWVRIYRNGRQIGGRKFPAGVTGLAVKPTGEKVVIAFAGQFLWLGGPALQPIGPEFGEGAEGDDTRLIYRPDGQAVAAYRVNDNCVREWSEQHRGVVLRRIDGDAAVTAIAYASPGHLGVARQDGTVRIYLRDQPGQQAIPSRKLVVRQMAFSPDGKRLALACGDESVEIWGLAPQEPAEPREPLDGSRWVQMLSIKLNGESGLAFSCDSRCLAAASARGIVVVGAVGE